MKFYAFKGHHDRTKKLSNHEELAIVTPRACARGKAIRFVRLSAQKLPDLEI